MNKLLKRNLIAISILCFLYLIVWIYFYQENTDYIHLLFSLIFGLLLLANLLPIILYLNYHFENKYTDFNIDEDLHLISITQKGLIKTYNFKDVKKSKYHIAYNYKNTIDNQGRDSINFSDFGYWDLEFNNRER